MRGEREKDRTNDILCMPAQKTTAAASTQKKGAEAAAANKCELDGVDGWMDGEASWGWDCWRKGGKGGRGGGGERERGGEWTDDDAMLRAALSLARSFRLDE